MRTSKLSPVNHLEVEALLRFQNSRGYKVPNLRSENIWSINCCRHITGQGFLSEISRQYSQLHVETNFKRIVWREISGVINYNIDIGMIVYVDSEFVSAIERFTYGARWPKEVFSVDLYT